MRPFTAIICVISLLFVVPAFAQNEKAVISGIVKDAVSDAPVEFATVYLKGTNTATETAANGRYRIEIPANQEVVLVVSRIGYKEISTTLEPMPARSSRQIDVPLAPSDSDIEVEVRGSKIEEGGMIREDVTQLKLLPSTTGN